MSTAYRYALTLTVELSIESPLDADALAAWADDVNAAAAQVGNVAEVSPARLVYAPTRYGVMTDYDHSAEHKRQRLTVWSGPFMSTFEGEAYSLPAGGFMVTTYNADKIRVTCPSPRDESNFEAVDAAISDALNAHHATRGAATLAGVTA